MQTTKIPGLKQNDNTDNETQTPNTNGPSGPLVINLNLQNPLAGTIDNILHYSKNRRYYN